MKKQGSLKCLKVRPSIQRGKDGGNNVQIAQSVQPNELLEAPRMSKSTYDSIGTVLNELNISKDGP